MGIIRKEHIVKELILGDGSNRIRKESVKDEAKAKAYIEGIKLLEDLKKQGCLEYKADDVSVPQYLHEIEINWTEDETELSGQRISDVLSKFDALVFTKEKVMADKWILSSEIYEEL